MHRIRVDREPDADVLTAEGELDAYSAPELAARLEQAAGSGALVVDLAGVSFLDSTALGMLVRALRDAAERGVAARVVLPATGARRIFEITTLDTTLPVAASRSDAMRELRAADAG